MTKNWKDEQIIFFKKYIKNFKPASVEYLKIEKYIKDIEKTITI